MNDYHKLFEKIVTKTGRKITKDEIENDLKDEGIDEFDIKLLFKKAKNIDEILKKYYNTLTNDRNKQKSKQLDKEELKKWLDQQHKQINSKNKRQRDYYKIRIQEIKQAAIDNNYDDRANTIEDDIKREWKKQNKTNNISIEDFIDKTFCDKDDTGKIIVDPDKVVYFIRTFVEAQEEGSDIDVEAKITIEETALLRGFNLKRSKNNYKAIQDEDPEESINEEKIGCFFRAEAPLEGLDGSDVFDTGSWFWLTKTGEGRAFNFAKYILKYYIETKGLSSLFNAQELEQNLRNFDFYEEDFVDSIKRKVEKLKTTYSHGKAKNNELFDFAIIEDAYNKKIIGDKTVAKLNKMSDDDYEKEKDKLERELVAYYLGFYKRKSKGLSYNFDQEVKDNIDANINIKDEFLKKLIKSAKSKSGKTKTGLAIIENLVAKTPIIQYTYKNAAGSYVMCQLDLDKLVDIGFLDDIED